MKVQVTVVAKHDNGHASVESCTLVTDDVTIVAGEARLLAEKAIYGRLQPTSRKDGGRG